MDLVGHSFPMLLLIATMGCVTVKPIHIRSDPNQESQERTEGKIEQSNIEAFIADHPELDSETKKALGDGTLSRHAALEKMKQKPPKN